MEKTSKELLKEFVSSQHFTSTTDIMNSMKELFSDVLQTVMEAELEDKLDYEKSERVSSNDEKTVSKNYRNGYSKKTVKTQLGEVDVKIPRDRNGEYEPQIIGKYDRNADGNLSKLGFGFKPTFDNVRGQRDRIIGISSLNIFPVGRDGMRACGAHTVSAHGNHAIKRKSQIMLASQATLCLIGFAFTQNFMECR